MSSKPRMKLHYIGSWFFFPTMIPTCFRILHVLMINPWQSSQAGDFPKIPREIVVSCWCSHGFRLMFPYFPIDIAVFGWFLWTSRWGGHHEQLSTPRYAAYLAVAALALRERRSKSRVGGGAKVKHGAKDFFRHGKLGIYRWYGWL